MWVQSLGQAGHGVGHGNPLQYSYLENPHGQRSLVGYSPRGYKESDMTERLSTFTVHWNKQTRGLCLFSIYSRPSQPS